MDVQDDVAEYIREWRAERCIGGEFENALVFVREAEFPLRADHAQRSDAANLAFAQLARLPGAWVDKLSADLRECDRLPLSQVRRPTDDLQRFLRAEIHRRQTQPIGIGMLLHRSHTTNDNMLPVTAAALDRLDLGTGHAQSVRQFFDRKVPVDVLSQPLQRNVHQAVPRN